MFENIHLTILNSAIIYIFIVVGIRMLGKKELGKLSITDLVFVMLISEAVGDVLRASNDTIVGGLIAALTLMVINRLFKIIMYRYKKVSEIMEGNPAVLIRHGKINKKEMRKNKINIDELEKAGRESGVSDISTVKLAILEIDGEISFLDDEKIKTNSKLDE